MLEEASIVWHYYLLAEQLARHASTTTQTERAILRAIKIIPQWSVAYLKLSPFFHCRHKCLLNSSAQSTFNDHIIETRREKMGGKKTSPVPVTLSSMEKFLEPNPLTATHQ